MVDSKGWNRHQKYHTATTVGQARKLGASLGDLRYDLAHDELEFIDDDP